MIKRLILKNRPSVIRLVIKAPTREKIVIKVSDPTKPNTLFTDRYAFIDNIEEFFVLMPQAPYYAEVSVYNERNGLQMIDNSFEVQSISSEDYIVPKYKFSKKTQSFIKFSQEFSLECGYLSYSKKGDIYKSNNGKFRIDYFDVIRSVANQRPLETPARISQLTGRIECSAQSFKKYSVPMRMAILLHEYAHYYINKNPRSEVQADLNGLFIYLKLGYPKIDIYNVFISVFLKSPTQQNKQRFDILNDFVRKNRL